MSCIPRILELKGDKEFLAVPTKTEIMRGVIIEDGGHYKGYDYLITFNDMGFRCGYVAISPDHPFYNKNLTGYSDNEEDFLIDVHGGITFFEKHSMAELLVKHPCEDKWIGFDCGHAGDLMDLETALKIFSFDEKISAGIKLMIEINIQVKKDMEKKYPDFYDFRKDPNSEFCDLLRTKEYVIDQCKHLIEQLIEKEAA